MSKIRCAEVQEMLPAYVDQPGAHLALRRHLSRCKACRAELERYESLAAGLSSLALRPIEPPAGLLRSLQAIPDQVNGIDAVRIHVLRNRRAYLSGAAVVVAGAAGAALWRTKRRLAPA